MGQGTGWRFVPRLEDSPEDPVWVGGLPYCPRWRGSRGEQGVGPPDDPLWAGGRGSGHYVVVPALQDCTPDLRWGLVAVRRWGGEVVVGVLKPAARRAVSRLGAVACSHWSMWSESAGWSFSAGARRRRAVPPRLTLVPMLCVRAYLHSMGGIQMFWSWMC